MKRMILILVVASMLLTACGGEATTSPTPTLDSIPVFNPTPTAPVVVGEVVTLRFAVYDWERSRYEDWVKVFEEDNPGIRVQLVSIEETLGLTPDDFTWPEEAWVRLASAADVVNVPPDRAAVRQGLLRDLGPFIEANTTFQPDDFYPGTLTQYQWEGGTWGIPTAVNYRLIFYDKKAFDQARLPYPEPGWTWADFLAAAKTLTLGEGDTVTRWGFVQPWPGHLQFIDNRVTLIDDSTDPPTPRFDRPDVMDAVRWYAALYREHQVTPYFAPDASGAPVSEGEQLIEKGQAAMWHGNSARWQWYKERNTQVNLGVVPYPVDAPDSHTTLMLSEGLSLSAGTAQPDAAWRWIDFLSRQVLYDLNEPSQLLPARRSVAEGSGFWDQVDDPPNMKVCSRGTRNVRMIVVSSVVDADHRLSVQACEHRFWGYFHARVAFTPVPSTSCCRVTASGLTQMASFICPLQSSVCEVAPLIGFACHSLIFLAICLIP